MTDSRRPPPPWAPPRAHDRAGRGFAPAYPPPRARGSGPPPLQPPLPRRPAATDPAPSARTPPLRARTTVAGLAALLGAISLVGTLVGAAAGADPSQHDLVLLALAGTIVIDAVAFIWIPYILIGNTRAGWAVLGLRRPTWSTWAWGLLALGLAFAIVSGYTYAVDQIGVGDLRPVGDIDDSFFGAHADLLILFSVLAVVVAPLTEEVFFRGFLFRGVAQRWGVLLGAVVSGACFGAVHLDLATIIPFAIVGGMFALVYQRSGNLFSTVAAHLAFNAIVSAIALAEAGVF